MGHTGLNEIKAVLILIVDGVSWLGLAGVQRWAVTGDAPVT